MTMLIARRVANQRLVRSACQTPAEVVASLGAIQSQDFPGAKWAIGLRAPVTDADVDRAYDEGAIVRTHILRQTWHFVAREDLRWMLALSGPRVNQVNGHYYRKLGLDASLFSRSQAVFERALRGGNQLTRPELGIALRRARMAADGLRLVFLVMRAELDGLICSGSRRGKQFTYALVDERVPPATPIDRDEALAMLARRYFVSHGPATLRDYVWWSGLTVRDAKVGIELAKPALVREDSAGLTYWSTGGRVPASSKSPAAYLLPNYDEYLIAYKDRATVVGPSAADGVRRIKDAFVHHLLYDGRLAGSWTRTLNGGTVAVELATYARTTDATKRAVAAAVGRLSKFLGARAISSWADRT